MNKSFWVAALAYLLPTFPLGYFWHLSIFADHYQQLAMYRDDVIIPLGLASMVLQALLYAWAYPRLFGQHDWRAGALRFGLVFGTLAWSLAVLPVAAKYRMSSVSGFLALESAFTVLQYLIVSPLIAWASSSQAKASSAAEPA
jgi:hypothetical protein